MTVGVPLHHLSDVLASGRESSDLAVQAMPTASHRKRRGTRPQSIQTSLDDSLSRPKPGHGVETPSAGSLFAGAADLDTLNRSTSAQTLHFESPHRPDHPSAVATPTYNVTQTTGPGFSTPTHFVTPMHPGGSVYATSYSVGPSPYFAYPGSAPFVQPAYSYHNPQPFAGQGYYVGPPGSAEVSYPPAGYVQAQPRYSLGNTSYLYHPQSPSPLPPQASSSKIIPSMVPERLDNGGAGKNSVTQGSDGNGYGRRLQHSQSIDLQSYKHDMEGTAWSRQAQPHGGGRDLPPVPEMTHPHGRTASVSTVSTSGPSTVSQHVGCTPNALPDGMSNEVVTPGLHRRSRSDLSHVKRGTARRLEIRCSVTEGRRLVFPDKVSPGPGLQDLDRKNPSGDGSDAGEPGLSTLDRNGRCRPPRSRMIPSLRTLDDGTAVVDEEAVLKTDLEWLRHDSPKPTVITGCEPEEHQVQDEIRQSGLATPKRVKVEESDETSSAKKRKRLETLANGRAEPIDATALPLSPTKRRGKAEALPLRQDQASAIKSFGRLAIKQELALKLLGLEEVPESEISRVDDATKAAHLSGEAIRPNDDQGGAEASLILRKAEITNLADAAPVNGPDWPDSIYPWSHEISWQEKGQMRQTRSTEAQRDMKLKHYVESPSDNELSDSDARAALIKHLRSRGVTSKTSSDAREAILHAKQRGKLPQERDLDSGAGLPIIAPADEAGCLCVGKNEQGGGMVCCDGCSAWYHLSCCGIETEDELEDQWFCQRCDPYDTPVRTTHIEDSSSEPVGIPVTPKLRQALGPTFSATDETTRSYHAHTSDAALAPSPTFSPGARFPISLMDTPALYVSPRIASGSSGTSNFATPGTPMNQTRPRIVSYAEHYNVCQTPGAPDSDYKKIYSTPKFEDFFDTGVMQSGSTPALRNPGSPTPLSKPRIGGLGLPAFTTPTSSQNFLRSLQMGPHGSTPALEFLPSSAGGSSQSPFPISPVHSANRVKYPLVITDSISPSPYREHRRQVSFGTRATSFSASASHLRDSVTFEGVEKGPLDLGGELKAPPRDSYAN